ncbi:MAG: hypothetical protein J6S21_01285, partial [Victivallales bacterium]|nr:hypothetical protein [Victivallales bacterium]
MSRFQGNIFFNPIFLLTLLLLAGGAVFLLGRSGKADGGQVEITVFTNPGATTPVLPLFFLAQEGRIPEARFNFRYWNSPVTLQSMMLAGDGVLWIGQTESLLKARDAGAPLRILAVTGWRKWQIVSRLHGKNFPADFCPDGRLDFAPPGAAGKLLVEKLLAGEGTELKFVPHELQSLMLRLVEGRCHTAMLPEPFATTILERLPDLKIV